MYPDLSRKMAKRLSYEGISKSLLQIPLCHELIHSVSLGMLLSSGVIGSFDSCLCLVCSILQVCGSDLSDWYELPFGSSSSLPIAIHFGLACTTHLHWQKSSPKMAHI